MKKIFTLIVLMAALLVPQNTEAQVKFGLKGGLNITNMSLSSDVLKAENRTGFFVGPTLLVKVPLVGLGFDASVLYDQREGAITAEGTTAEVTVKQQTIQVPINLRYSFGLSSLASIYFFAGPQFGFNVGDKDQSGYTLKDSNFSVNLGLGTLLMNHLQISANYNIACGKTSEFDSKTIVGEAVSTIMGSTKHNAWQIALAYYF